MKFLRSWKFRLLLFFAVVGPGFITANVDNDAGGILTYSLPARSSATRSCGR
jgi:Mn2+/Fe2+ NRAMP family transporter